MQLQVALVLRDDESRRQQRAGYREGFFNTRHTPTLGKLLASGLGAHNAIAAAKLVLREDNSRR